MYRHLLVPLDHSELAERALDHAVELARLTGATISLVHVLPNAAQASNIHPHVPTSVALQWRAELRQASETYLEQVRKTVAEKGIYCTVVLREGDVAEEVLEYASSEGCDLIVMSTHGRSGIGRWLWGSVAERVVHHSRVPVLLIRVSPEAEEPEEEE